MTTVISKGEEAIHYAEVHNLALNTYAASGIDARSGVSADQARRIAVNHPELVWVETHIAVNSGEDEEE